MAVKLQLRVLDSKILTARQFKVGRRPTNAISTKFNDKTLDWLAAFPIIHLPIAGYISYGFLWMPKVVYVEILCTIKPSIYVVCLLC